MNNPLCLTNDNINCTSTTNLVPPKTCETIDKEACIKVDQEICNATITQGISEIKDLLTNGISCSSGSGTSGCSVNLGPVTSLLGSNSDCTGANNNCSSVLGSLNAITRNLGQDNDTLNGRDTVFTELSTIKTTIGTGCSESVCSELNNLEGLVNNGINNLGNLVNSSNNLLNDSTNGLAAIKTAISNSISGNCGLSTVTNLIGASGGSTLFQKEDAILGKLGGTSDTGGTTIAGSLMAKENAILGQLGTCGTSVCTSLATLTGASYLKCSDFNAFKTALNTDLSAIFSVLTPLGLTLLPAVNISYTTLPAITC